MILWLCGFNLHHLSPLLRVCVCTCQSSVSLALPFLSNFLWNSFPLFLLCLFSFSYSYWKSARFLRMTSLGKRKLTKTQATFFPFRTSESCHSPACFHRRFGLSWYSLSLLGWGGAFLNGRINHRLNFCIVTTQLSDSTVTEKVSTSSKAGHSDGSVWLAQALTTNKNSHITICHS